MAAATTAVAARVTAIFIERVLVYEGWTGILIGGPVGNHGDNGSSRERGRRAQWSTGYLIRRQRQYSSPQASFTHVLPGISESVACPLHRVWARRRSRAAFRREGQPLPLLQRSACQS